ncbi:TonB-dependent receptor [Sphingobium sufflavum]|uniref:TonB-dependent receptor n=1 Tax=Sphingobium sufflavum TaxID=1129547 RepID=UPI001F1D6035|nr:TonB-dependent receptor [Sphingobium sufflavum]MCE7796419.1 TonB-dependent receptor [Sphingobium sufflavum]
MKGIAFLAGVSLPAVLAATPALAQSPAIDAGQPSVEDIVVTAQRRAERTQDVPISVTSISADALQQANIQQLGDIVKLTPATRFDYQANFVQPTVRGVGNAVVTAGAGSNVGIYVDGFYMPNPLGSDFQLLNLQGIQVLKGPQGTLFGRNTTGGAILVTSNKPSQTARGVLEASYGSFNTVGVKGYATAGLTGKLAFDIEGAFRSSDGYIHNIVASGPRHPGRLTNWSIRLGLNVELSETVSFLLRYSHQDVDDNSNTAPTVLVQDRRVYAPYEPPYAGATPRIPANQIATGYRQAAINAGTVPGFRFKGDAYQLTGSFDLDFADLASYTQYRVDNSMIFADNDQTAADINYNQIPVRNETFTQELLLTSKAGGRLQWTAGLFYINNLDEFNPVRSGTSPATLGANVHTHVRTQSIAGYLDATYEIVDNLFLTGGARYAHDKIDRAYIDVANGFFHIPYPDRSSDRVTPRAVLRYALNPRSSVYASYTRGYKAGLTDVVVGLYVPGDDGRVEPEVMDAYEIGYKYASRAFSLNLAGWYYDYQNLQFSVYPGGLAEVLNAATARIYGVEGDVRYQVTPDFEVTASGAYVDAKYRTVTQGARYVQGPDGMYNAVDFATAGYDASGKPMQRAPKFTASVGARYGLDLEGGHLTLSGNLYHTSTFYFDPAQQFYQKAYQLLGLRAEWTDPSDRFTLAVYGDNVTGSRYYSQVLTHAPGIGAVWGAPATIGGSVRAKF